MQQPQHVKNVCKVVAVLNWLIEGYKQYVILGEIPTHPWIQEATDEMFSEFDEVASFSYECVLSHSKRESLSARWQDRLHHGVFNL